jgi:predicted porin
MVEIPRMVRTQLHLAIAVSMQRRKYQKKIKLLGALGCRALATAAQAQGSVTLYGSLDTAIGYVSNQPKANGGTGSAFQAINGTLSANSWA